MPVEQAAHRGLRESERPKTWLHSIAAGGDDASLHLHGTPFQWWCDQLSCIGVERRAIAARQTGHAAPGWFMPKRGVKAPQH